MNRAVTVHGWYGHPTDNWWPSLTNSLQAQGFQTISPQFPNTENPKATEWLATLEKALPNPDRDTYFVGHSLGCLTILKYLQQLPAGVQVGGAVLVAGFTKNLDFDGYNNALANYFDEPLDWDAVRAHCDKFWVISSDNDAVVDRENHEHLVQELGAHETWEHNKHHFLGGEGVTELPSAVNAVLRLAAN